MLLSIIRVGAGVRVPRRSEFLFVSKNKQQSIHLLRAPSSVGTQFDAIIVDETRKGRSILATKNAFQGKNCSREEGGETLLCDPMVDLSYG